MILLWMQHPFSYFTTVSSHFIPQTSLYSIASLLTISWRSLTSLLILLLTFLRCTPLNSPILLSSSKWNPPLSFVISLTHILLTPHLRLSLELLSIHFPSPSVLPEIPSTGRKLPWRLAFCTSRGWKQNKLQKVSRGLGAYCSLERLFGRLLKWGVRKIFCYTVSGIGCFCWDSN